MEALLNESHLAAALRDKPRNKSLVRMRVINRNTLNLNVSRFNTIGPGTHEIDVYEDEVSKVRALVEPQPETLKAAETLYKRKLAEKVRGQLPNYTGTAEDVLALVESKKHGKEAKQARELYELACESEPLSVQRCFTELAGHDVLPLVAADLVANSTHAEPQREAHSRDQMNLIAAVVATMQTMQANPVQAEIADQAAKITKK